MRTKLLYSREEMQKINIETLKSRGVTVEDIAAIAWKQQSKYTPDIPMSVAIESVEKILRAERKNEEEQLRMRKDR